MSVIYDYPISTLARSELLTLRDGPDGTLIATLPGDDSGDHVCFPMVADKLQLAYRCAVAFGNLSRRS